MIPAKESFDPTKGVTTNRLRNADLNEQSEQSIVLDYWFSHVST